MAVVGVSTTAVCGVRDHARILAEGMSARGWECTMHWLDREQSGLAAERREVRSWLQGLPGELADARAEAIVLHYSVFSYGHRGIPLFVHPLLAVLRRSGLPVITIVHEAAYPWGIGGARGKLWALTQRLALAELVLRSAALLVTADFRARWLRTRRWLARRPIATAPVFSNLPAPSPGSGPGSPGDEIGLFGYAYEGAGAGLVLDALALVRRQRPQARLTLLGAPGEDSDAGHVWRRLARERGVDGGLSFTGTLPGQEISDAMAGCDVLLSINAGGPTSRKGSLAGSLGSGTPVIALDGERRWGELVEAGALRVCDRAAEPLAAAIVELLGDPEAARALGERGGRFARERMGVPRTIAALNELLDGLGAPGKPV